MRLVAAFLLTVRVVVSTMTALAAGAKVLVNFAGVS